MGKAQFHEFEFTKRIDASSAKLMLALEFSSVGLIMLLIVMVLFKAGWKVHVPHLEMQGFTPKAFFLGLVLAQAAMMSTWGPFWSLPTAFLSGRAAAGADARPRPGSAAWESGERTPGP